MVREVGVNDCPCRRPPSYWKEDRNASAGKPHMVSTSATMPTRKNVRTNVSAGFLP